jgi:hypothetical protein
MLALGPILLGVPHWPTSGIRGGAAYKRWWIILLAGPPLIATGLGAGVEWGLLGAAAAIAVSRTTHTRRAIGLAVVLPVAGLALWAGWWADLIFAHAHNFIAVLLWWVWRQRKTNLHFIPLGIFVAAVALSDGRCRSDPGAT